MRDKQSSGNETNILSLDNKHIVFIYLLMESGVTLTLLFSFFLDSAACVQRHCVLRLYTVISLEKVEAVMYSLRSAHNQMKAVHVLCMEVGIYCTIQTTHRRHFLAGTSLAISNIFG